jgi:hypothetical protein
VVSLPSLFPPLVMTMSNEMSASMDEGLVKVIVPSALTLKELGAVSPTTFASSKDYVQLPSGGKT